MGRGLKVEAGGGIVEAFGRDGVDVALAQDDVVAAADFDLVAVLWVEQHSIIEFHRPHARPCGHDKTPRETLADLSGSGNQDAATRLAIAVDTFELDQNPIAQHLDGQLALCLALGLRSCFVLWHGANGTVPRHDSGPRPRSGTPCALHYRWSAAPG